MTQKKEKNKNLISSSEWTSKQGFKFITASSRYKDMQLLVYLFFKMLCCHWLFLNRDFSTIKNIDWCVFFLHLSLEHDLEGQPAQEEHQLSQGDQGEATTQGQPATNCT